jgi:hypothetical protein
VGNAGHAAGGPAKQAAFGRMQVHGIYEVLLFETPQYFIKLTEGQEIFKGIDGALGGPPPEKADIILWERLFHLFGGHYLLSLAMNHNVEIIRHGFRK